MQAIERERTQIEARLSTAGLAPADLADAGRQLKTLQDELAQLEEAWLTHASAIEALAAAPAPEQVHDGG